MKTGPLFRNTSPSESVCRFLLVPTNLSLTRNSQSPPFDKLRVNSIRIQDARRWQPPRISYPDYRVGQGACAPLPPSEPYVIVSHHTAQAPLKVLLIVIPANKICFMIIIDCQCGRSRKGAPIPKFSIVICVPSFH